MSTRILVTGATGKGGQAFIQHALEARPEADFVIRIPVTIPAWSGTQVNVRRTLIACILGSPHPSLST